MLSVDSNVDAKLSDPTPPDLGGLMQSYTSNLQNAQAQRAENARGAGAAAFDGLDASLLTTPEAEALSDMPARIDECLLRSK
jgi:hypothetical protein